MRRTRCKAIWKKEGRVPNGGPGKAPAFTVVHVRATVGSPRTCRREGAAELDPCGNQWIDRRHRVRMPRAAPHSDRAEHQHPCRVRGCRSPATLAVYLSARSKPWTAA